MNEQVIQLLENYKNGVPVKIERSSIIALCAAAVLTVAVSAMVVRIINKI